MRTSADRTYSHTTLECFRNDIRSLAIDACTTLLMLDPKLSDADLFQLLEIITAVRLLSCFLYLKAFVSHTRHLPIILSAFLTYRTRLEIRMPLISLRDSSKGMDVF